MYIYIYIPQIASAIGVPMSYGGPNPLETHRSRKVVPELRMARLGAHLLQNRVFYSTCEHESLNPMVFKMFRANPVIWGTKTCFLKTSCFTVVRTCFFKNISFYNELCSFFIKNSVFFKNNSPICRSFTLPANRTRDMRSPDVIEWSSGCYHCGLAGRQWTSHPVTRRLLPPVWMQPSTVITRAQEAPRNIVWFVRRYKCCW